MNRPDYVKCALTGMFDGPDKQIHDTWCGRTNVYEFAFTDASHAILNARNRGRLLLCPECSKAIAKTLEEGTWTP